MPRSARLALITLAALPVLLLAVLGSVRAWDHYQEPARAAAFCAATPAGSDAVAVWTRAQLDRGKTAIDSPIYGPVHHRAAINVYYGACTCHVPFAQGLPNGSGTARVTCGEGAQ